MLIQNFTSHKETLPKLKTRSSVRSPVFWNLKNGPERLFGLLDHNIYIQPGHSTSEEEISWSLIVVFALVLCYGQSLGRSYVLVLEVVGFSTITAIVDEI